MRNVLTYSIGRQSNLLIARVLAFVSALLICTSVQAQLLGKCTANYSGTPMNFGAVLYFYGNELPTGVMTDSITVKCNIPENFDRVKVCLDMPSGLYFGGNDYEYGRIMSSFAGGGDWPMDLDYSLFYGPGYAHPIPSSTIVTRDEAPAIEAYLSDLDEFRLVSLKFDTIHGKIWGEVGYGGGISSNIPAGRYSSNYRSNEITLYYSFYHGSSPSCLRVFEDSRSAGSGRGGYIDLPAMATNLEILSGCEIETPTLSFGTLTPHELSTQGAKTTGQLVLRCTGVEYKLYSLKDWGFDHLGMRIFGKLSSPSTSEGIPYSLTVTGFNSPERFQSDHPSTAGRVGVKARNQENGVPVALTIVADIAPQAISVAGDFTDSVPIIVEY